MSEDVQRILELGWEKWLERPFYAFIISLFRAGSSKAAFKKIGLAGWSDLDFIFAEGNWYRSEKVFSQARPAAKNWLKNHSVAEINDSLEKFYQEQKALIIKLAAQPAEKTGAKLKIVAAAMKVVATYVWAAHILEDVISPGLKEKTAQYIKKDLDKFVRDASFPSRLSALSLLEKEIRQGASAQEISQKYGWMRTRDGFTRPYSKEEIKEYARSLKKSQNKHQYPSIPQPLRKIFFDVQELVHLRTYRTDVLYELLFLARPILKAIGKKHRIPFSQLKYYDIQSLINGRPLKYPKKFTAIGCPNKLLFLESGVLKTEKVIKVSEIKGMVARPGIVKGTAKVVTNLKDLSKVKKGDILVTYMTSPNFLSAMKLAAAFVTDEGGITCHAAIIAREMKKPCVIGTKIATRVIKDGSLVEVNANQGTIKIIK